MKLDFSVHEQQLQHDIKEYLEAYKLSFNHEKKLLKQIKNNLEMFDFLNFKDDAKEINETLAVKWDIVYNSLIKYQNFLREYFDSLDDVLDGMTRSAQRTKDALYLRKLCNQVENKIALLGQATCGDILSLMIIEKNISVMQAVYDYTASFPITRVLAKRVIYIIHKKLLKYSLPTIIISCILIILGFILGNVYGSIFCLCTALISIMIASVFIVIRCMG